MKSNNTSDFKRIINKNSSIMNKNVLKEREKIDGKK